MSAPDAKQVLELKKQLVSAGNDKNTKEMLRVLNELKSTVVATETLVRETKIGVAVSKFRHSDVKEVGDLAREIVRKWKADVTGGAPIKADKKAPPALTPKASSPVPKTEEKPAPKVEDLTKDSSGDDAAPKKITKASDAPRTHKTDNVTVPDFGLAIRKTCASLLYDSLAFDSDYEANAILRKALEIETHVRTTLDDAAYRTKLRSLVQNIKHKDNRTLRDNIVTGRMKVDMLCSLPVKELAPDNLKKLYKQLDEENLFKARGAAPQQAETDAFQCGKCKQRRTMYYQMQTRSADEPMTTFVTCLNCDNRWKFS